MASVKSVVADSKLKWDSLIWATGDHPPWGARASSMARPSSRLGVMGKSLMRRAYTAWRFASPPWSAVSAACVNSVALANTLGSIVVVLAMRTRNVASSSTILAASRRNDSIVASYGAVTMPSEHPPCRASHKPTRYIHSRHIRSHLAGVGRSTDDDGIAGNVVHRADVDGQYPPQ